MVGRLTASIRKGSNGLYPGDLLLQSRWILSLEARYIPNGIPAVQFVVAWPHTGTQLPPEQTGEKQILRLPLKAGRPEHEQQMTGRKARKKGGHEREASDVCHPV